MKGRRHEVSGLTHRILPGRTDQSYGLHDARLAATPASAVPRGRKVAASLAVHHAGASSEASSARTQTAKIPPRPAQGAQFSLFTEYLPHPALAALREIKLDRLTPLQAFDELRRLHEQARGQ